MVASGEKTAHQGRAIQIMIRLADIGDLTTKQLVEILGMKRSNVSAYLTKLRLEEFVKTGVDPRNKSVKPHSLTSKGREYLDTLS